MYGGLPLAEPVRMAKSYFAKAPISFGPWREDAGHHLTTAALNGLLPLHVDIVRELPIGPGLVAITIKGARTPNELVSVPPEVLKRLIKRRGTLLDRASRPTTRATNGDAKLLYALTNGILVIQFVDFSDWIKSECKKTTWPSQRSSLKPRNGRPPKMANAARQEIIRFLHENRWSRRAGILELHRLLVAAGNINVPSPDTLARVADDLYRQTGDARLMR